MALFRLLTLSLGFFCAAANATQFDSAFYHQRYALKDIYGKKVDNHGDGHAALYGTRNFREVLKGVLFRGGANNVYLRANPRANMNPLPDVGLTNLCKEGFQKAIYLYEENYATAPHQVNCNSVRGSNRLSYPQLNYQPDNHEILKQIRDAINDANKGPIYVHCWNGWHASGSISAFALRQFCGVSGDNAEKYWINDTDGHDDEPQYQKIKTAIKAFVPYADLKIDTATKARICPKL